MWHKSHTQKGLTTAPFGAIIYFYTQKESKKVFKIGDYVSYQTRNKNARERFALSFHQHHGHIISITDKEIQVERYNSQDNKEFFRSVTVFRKLRNGQWIACSQTHDDPKGRLHLKPADSDDYCDWLAHNCDKILETV